MIASSGVRIRTKVRHLKSATAFVQCRGVPGTDNQKDSEQSSENRPPRWRHRRLAGEPRPTSTETVRPDSVFVPQTLVERRQSVRRDPTMLTQPNLDMTSRSTRRDAQEACPPRWKFPAAADTSSAPVQPPCRSSGEENRIMRPLLSSLERKIINPVTSQVR